MSRPDDLLPFLGPGTDGDQFEAFCHDLLARSSGFADVRRWGVSGDAQAGVDLLATRDGDAWAFQCKREAQFGPKKAREAIAGATHPADHYVLLLGRPATRRTRETVEGAGWKLWDATDLSQRARALPTESGVQLVRAHFGPAIAEAFLGVSADLPWLPLADFFEPFLRPGRLFSHVHSLAGREPDVEGLVDFSSGDRWVALVSGRGGVGKSRLVLEVGRRLEAAGTAVRVLDPDRAVRPDDLRMLPLEDPVLLVADDAHRRSDVAAVARLITTARERGRDVRLLLTTRPYGLGALRSSVADGGADATEIYEAPPLADLTGDDLRALASEALGPDLARNDFLVRRLVDAADDSPLILSLGAALVRRGQIDPGQIRTDDDLRRTVLGRFQDEALGTVAASVPPPVALATLRVTAAAGPLQTDRTEATDAAASVASLDPVAFRQALGALEVAGVLVRRGRQVRVSPDVLADHLLAEAALLPDGTSTGYAERVFEALAPHAGPTVLRNLAELDWRQRQSDTPTDLLARTWSTIAETFRGGDAGERVRVLQLVRDAAYFLPERVLDLCRLAVEAPAADAPAPTGFGSTQDDVLHELPELLKRVAHTLGTDRLRGALDLLWRLAQQEGDVIRPYPEAAGKTLVDLAKPGRYRSHRWHHAVLDAAERWAAAQAARLAGWDGDPANLPRFLASRVIVPTLDRSVDLSYSEGYTLFLRRGWPLAHLPPVRAVRRRALQLLERYGLDGGPAGAVAVAGPLADHVKNRDPLQGTDDPDVLRAFASESRWALVALGRLLDAHPDAHLADVVWRRTHWFAARGPDGLRRRAVRRLRCRIEAVPDWPLVRALHRRGDRWVGPNNGEEETTASWSAHAAQNEAQQEATARSYLDREIAPTDAADTLAHLLDRINQFEAWTHTSGTRVVAHAWDFFEAVGRLDPGYARRLAAALFARGDVHAPRVAALLAGARKRGEALDRLIDLARGEATQRLAAAQALHAVFWRGTPTDEEWELLEQLLADPDTDVQTVAVRTWQGALNRMPSRGRPLLTVIPTDAAQAAANELFSTVAYSLDDPLTEAERDHLLALAEAMPSLDDSAVLSFLKAESDRDPRAVYALLSDRVRSESESLTAIPFDPGVHLFENTPDDVRAELLGRAVRLRAGVGEAAPQYAAHRLVALLAEGVPPVVVQAMTQLLASGPDEADVALDVLRDVPRRFPFEHPDAVRSLFHAAEQGGGVSRRERAESALRTAAQSGMRERSPGSPCAEDLWQRDRALDLVDALDAEPALSRFYKSLARVAEASIERDRLDDIEQERG